MQRRKIGHDFLGGTDNLHSTETPLAKSWPDSGPQLVWEVKRGTGHAPPVVAGGSLVQIHGLGENEVIDCLDAETGKLHWSHSYPVQFGSNYGISDAPRSAPVIDGELIFTLVWPAISIA